MANCIRCGRQLPGFSFKKVCQWCVQHEAAQRGEESDDVKQHVMPAPWVRRSQSTISLTQVLFGANVAVYLAMALASGSVVDFPGETAARFGANFGPYTLSGDWWRLVTYMFLHGGILHIAFNMWCLWDLGALSESLYGRWTFASIYLITGVSGGLASVAWNPRVLSVGASGAIFGLAGALIASFYLGEFSLPSIAIGGTLRSLVVFAVFNLFFGSMFGGIDNACHIGGLVSGLILGAFIAKLAPQQDAPLRRVGVLGVVVLALLAAGAGVRNWRGGPMRMARALQQLGENADPVARYQAVVKEQPNSPQAHFGLGAAYFNRQQFPQAEAEYKRVLELDPQSSPAMFNLGLAYLNEKRADDAKAAFTKMLAKDATNAQGHYGLGLVLTSQQLYQAAIDEFKAAAAKGTPMSDLYYQMGNCYTKLDMYDDAVAAYLKERDISGDDPQLESNLADAYQAKGMNQQAQDARERVQQLKSGAQ
jgi:rhomboid protease GluP